MSSLFYITRPRRLGGRLSPGLGGAMPGVGPRPLQRVALPVPEPLPLDRLKIDQSFVGKLMNDPRDLAIVNTNIVPGRVPGIGVIAQGVETLERRALLAGCGRRQYQGYLLSRPLTEEALAAHPAQCRP